MKQKVFVKCPNSGEQIDVQNLLQPFIFYKPQLEEIIKSNRWGHRTILFSDMLKQINSEGGKAYDSIKNEVIY